MIAAKEGQEGYSMEITREKLLADFKVLIADAEELVKATANQAGERATIARQRIGGSLEEAKKSLTDAENILIDKTKEAAKKAEVYVKENPWNALGIAAGAGLLFGLLIRR